MLVSLLSIIQMLIWKKRSLALYFSTVPLQVERDKRVRS